MQRIHFTTRFSSSKLLNHSLVPHSLFSILLQQYTNSKTSFLLCFRPLTTSLFAVGYREVFVKLKYRTPRGSENRISAQRPSAINFPLWLGASQYFSQIDISSALVFLFTFSTHHLCQFFTIAEKIDNYSVTAGRLHF